MLDHHLRVFVTVAEKKNFSRAGEALNLTQPAISQHIHTLEDHYKAKLFERSNKKVELTQAGSVLYTYARQILALHQTAERAVTDLIDLVTGKVVVGASLTIGEYVLPRLLAAFAKQYPDVEFSVNIVNTELVHEQTLEGSIDIGLVEGPVEHDTLEMQPFLKDEMVLIVPNQFPLARRSMVTKKDIKDCSFILREEGSGTRYVSEAILHSLEIEPQHIIQLGSTQAIKEAVEAGLGISFVSKWSIRKELSLSSLKMIRIKDVDLSREFNIIRNRTKFVSRASEEFTKFITSPDVLEHLR